MKLSTKMIALLLIVSIVCFAGIAGCGKSGDETAQNPETTKPEQTTGEAAETEEAVSGPETLEPCELNFSYFSAGDTNAEVLQNMLGLFNEAYPDITVTGNTTGYGEYFNNLVAQFASGDAPDIFELNAENFISFVTRGQTAPIGPVLEDLGAGLAGYNQGLLTNFCSDEGELHALPFSFSTVVMVYNMDMFDAAGLAYPDDSWTMDDVLAAARELAKPDEDIWGFSTEMHQLWAFYKKAAWNGGGVISEDGTRFIINSPENIETFQMLQDLIWVHHVMPTQDEYADRSNLDLFAENKLAMCDAGIWAFAEFKEKCPDINWGVCVEPGIKQKGTAVYCNMLCVSPSSEYQAQAAALANFMCSDPGVVQLRLDAAWELPGVSDPASMEAYVKDTPPDNKQAVLDSAAYSVAPPVLKDFQVLVEIMGKYLEELRDGLISAEEALNGAQAEAEETIDLSEQ